MNREWIKQGLSYIGETIRVIVISLAIILPIRYFLVQPFYVKGASMEPNFYDKEYLVIDELSYRVREPARGEIVVFRYPVNPSQFFIKRIIGLPGETVEVDKDKIKIINKEHPDGFTLEEPYIDTENEGMTANSETLKDGQYYVLGDNRRSSLDSRIFGPLDKDRIIGRVWLRGWPLNRIERFLSPQY